MGKGSSPPPAPDYREAAESTSASQRVNQYTPYGTQIWGDNLTSDGQRMWNSTITLNPQAQSALDSQMALSSGLGGIAQDQLGAVADRYSQPLDLSSVQDVSDRAYGAMTSRLDPRFERAQVSEETKLTNQGLRPGMEAWDNAMRVFNEGKNDAYQQANLGAIQTMPQTFQLENSMYNQPLNILNSIRSGAQVQNPQFSGPGAGTNYLGAAQSQGQYNQGLYNADVAGNNAMMGGLFGLGSAGIGAYGLMNAAPAAMAVSDRRLKSNIVRVGTHPLGIGVYEYDIFGRRQVGVMADEVEKVMPEAVVDVGGFKAVDYGMLNG